MNKKVYILICIVFFSIVNRPVNGSVQYFFDENSIFGDDEALIMDGFKPSNVFLIGNSLFVTDMNNSKVYKLNSNNFSIEDIVIPINQDESLENFLIYQTVVSQNTTYYSVISNGTIIKYKSDGVIIGKLELDLPEGFDSRKISIAIDKNNLEPLLLVNYLQKNNTAGGYYYQFAEINNEFDQMNNLTTIDAGTGNMQFSYHLGSPQFIFADYGSEEKFNNHIVSSALFMWVNNKYVPDVKSLGDLRSNNFDPFSAISSSQISFNISMGLVIIQTGSDIIAVDQNYKYAGILTIPIESTVQIISANMDYDFQNNVIFILIESHNLIIKLQIIEILAQESSTSTNGKNDDSDLFHWLNDFLVSEKYRLFRSALLILVVLILLRYWRKRQNK